MNEATLTRREPELTDAETLRMVFRNFSILVPAHVRFAAAKEAVRVRNHYRHVVLAQRPLNTRNYL